MTSEHRLTRGANRLAEVASLYVYQRSQPGNAVVSSFPPCPEFWAPNVVGPTVHRLELALSGGMFEYVMGVARGVGVTWLLKAYRDSVRERAADGTSPVLLMSVLSTAQGRRPFLDALGTTLGVRLNLSSLTVRDATTVAETLLAALRTHRVRALLVDHAHRVSSIGWEILAHLVQISHGRGGEADALSIVVASHLHPAHVLPPALAAGLSIVPSVVPLYEPDDIAFVLPELELVGPDFDPAREPDGLLVEAIHEATQGHISRMHTLFRCMRALRRKGRHADLDLVRYAVHYTESLTHLIEEPLTDAEGAWQPAARYHLVAESPAAPEPPARPEAGVSLDPPSLERIKQRRDAMARATSMRRSLTQQRRTPRKRS